MLLQVPTTALLAERKIRRHPLLRGGACMWNGSNVSKKRNKVHYYFQICRILVLNCKILSFYRKSDRMAAAMRESGRDTRVGGKIGKRYFLHNKTRGCFLRSERYPPRVLFFTFFRSRHILIFRQRVLGLAKVGENVLPVDDAGLIRSNYSTSK